MMHLFSSLLVYVLVLLTNNKDNYNILPVYSVVINMWHKILHLSMHMVAIAVTENYL